MPSGSFRPNVDMAYPDGPVTPPPQQDTQPTIWQSPGPAAAQPGVPDYYNYNNQANYPPYATGVEGGQQGYATHQPPYGQPALTPPPRQHIPGAMTPPPRPRRYDAPPLPIRIVDWLKGNWWAPVVVISLLLVVFDIMYQVFLPYNAVPQGVVVDGVPLGGLEHSAAVSRLDEAYGNAKAKVFFGNASVPYKTPTGRELGISVNNQERLKNAHYSVWWRLVPTSSFWIGSTIKASPALYSYDTATLDTYTLKNLGNNCKINPKDATLRLDDNRFSVVPAVAGGTCNLSEFKAAVQKATIKDGGYTIRTAMKETPATLGNHAAKELADKLNKTLAQDIPITANDKQDTVPAHTAKTWLSFKTVTPEAKPDDPKASEPRLAFTVEPDRVKKYIQSSRLAGAEQKPGTTTVSTRDFTETSRQEGKPGVAINIAKTTQSAADVADGKTRTMVATVEPVGPTVVYKRSYTPTEEGFKALVQQFSEDNKGDIAIAVTELTGRKPLVVAATRGGEAIPAGGLEGALVAYTAQVGIENGSIQPTNKVAGSQTYTDCIKTAITEQDKECIDGLLSGVGNATVQQRLRDIGLNNTQLGEHITTTADDIQTFMRKLAEKKELPTKKLEPLTSAMRSLQQRDGIVVGQNNIEAIAGTEGAYNQAGVITSQGGRYVVTFLSKSSNASTAAKFIAEFDKLRSQKPARN